MKRLRRLKLEWLNPVSANKCYLSQSGKVNTKNIVDGKRKKVVQVQDDNHSTPATTTPVSPHKSKQSADTSVKNGGGKKARIAIGDLVSLPAGAFDGDVKGSFSDDHPDKCIGKVLEIDS